MPIDALMSISRDFALSMVNAPTVLSARWHVDGNQNQLCVLLALVDNILLNKYLFVYL